VQNFSFNLLTREKYLTKITVVPIVIECHTMKHNTKAVSRALKTAKNRMIGLRLDDDFMREIEQLAAAEERSLADTARICVRIGLKERKALIEAAVEK
tara:strand:+ start:9642 stop:9935 length:294 start_codon:yes stop_codon:yes gene_type:complete